MSEPTFCQQLNTSPAQFGHLKCLTSEPTTILAEELAMRVNETADNVYGAMVDLLAGRGVPADSVWDATYDAMEQIDENGRADITKWIQQ